MPRRSSLSLLPVHGKLGGVFSKMAMYAQGTKRQKTRDARTYDSNEFFPGITRLEHRPDAGVDDSLCFRHYSPGERVHGRSIEEWIRPAVSLWHTFHYQGTDSHGTCTFTRSWDEAGQSTQEIHKRRVKAAFELCTKLGNGYDRDLSPEGDSLEETQQTLDEAVEMTLELQQKCNVKPLWFGCNLFQHPR
ncbi:hypothetical protein B566_EDAN011555 [Ephemera danica]|nr:hypothetical protein B566_EDAN011555 [Ephemera danica]